MADLWGRQRKRMQRGRPLLLSVPASAWPPCQVGTCKDITGVANRPDCEERISTDDPTFREGFLRRCHTVPAPSVWLEEGRLRDKIVRVVSSPHSSHPQGLHRTHYFLQRDQEGGEASGRGLPGPCWPLSRLIFKYPTSIWTAQLC